MSSLRTLVARSRRSAAMLEGVARRGLANSPSSCAWFAGFSKEKEETAAHSKLLSKGEQVYELVTEVVVPAQWEQYLANKRLQIQAADDNPGIKGELVASWQTVVGDRAFKAIHLYKYQDGWNDIDGDRLAKKSCPDFQAIAREGLPTITEQGTELAKAFNFWPSPESRAGSNVYDIRTYYLKPGSLYDWSNYWSRGIKLRGSVRADVPYCGLFTQLGQLHTIYHIWCYTSMADRKACREATWHYDGWNDIVANTVPLVNTMSTRILEPLEFSPTQ